MNFAGLLPGGGSSSSNSFFGWPLAKTPTRRTIQRKKSPSSLGRMTARTRKIVPRNQGRSTYPRHALKLWTRSVGLSGARTLEDLISESYCRGLFTGPSKYIRFVRDDTKPKHSDDLSHRLILIMIELDLGYIRIIKQAKSKYCGGSTLQKATCTGHHPTKREKQRRISTITRSRKGVKSPTEIALHHPFQVSRSKSPLCTDIGIIIDGISGRMANAAVLNVQPKILSMSIPPTSS